MKALQFIRSTKRGISILFLFLFSLSLNVKADVNDPNVNVLPLDEAELPPEGGVIKLALLLDTSNSMDGLIEQAKSQLWKIVNEINKAKYNGKPADLEIALYEYGNDGLEVADNYVHQITPFTADLDLISMELFDLKTNGGSEYCGHVISDALNDLEWGSDQQSLKLIFIAGNEPFNQAPVENTPKNSKKTKAINPYQSVNAPQQNNYQAQYSQASFSIAGTSDFYITACRNALEKQVFVNTIFCGDADEGVQTFWKKGADLARGEYMNIDQDQETFYIETPFDDKIAALNEKLNNTYIPYGASGGSMKYNQTKQDANASFYGKANSVNRIVSKSSHNYKNSSWDLVDAYGSDDFDLADIEDKFLPKEMQGMSLEEKEVFIQDKAKERAAIKQEIKTINVERVAFIDAKKKEMGDDSGSLDAAMIQAIHEQAKTKGFLFD
ncbi:hypothetical protein [Parvicella tangerina]|nr:hypothetical protein [Parvicella tangerina]